MIKSENNEKSPEELNEIAVLRKAMGIGEYGKAGEDEEIRDFDEQPVNNWINEADVQIIYSVLKEAGASHDFVLVLNTLYEKAGSPKINADLKKEKKYSRLWQNLLMAALYAATTAQYLKIVQSGELIKEHPMIKKSEVTDKDSKKFPLERKFGLQNNVIGMIVMDEELNKKDQRYSFSREPAKEVAKLSKILFTGKYMKEGREKELEKEAEYLEGKLEVEKEYLKFLLNDFQKEIEN